DAVERAVGIALARLVVEREDDLAFDVAGVVVVRERRRADAEADEDDRRADAPARAEAMRIELDAEPQLPGAGVAAPDLGRVPGGNRRGPQVVGLEVRAGGGGLQPRALEARPDVVAGRAVLVGVREPPFHGVAREKKQVGAELVLPDGLVLRRARRLRA